MANHLQSSQPIIWWIILGIVLTCFFFMVAVLTTYHIDLGIAQLLFPYSVVADPHITFKGIALVLAVLQWPLYALVGGLAREKKGTRIGRGALLFMVLLLIGHCITTGFAYHRHGDLPRRYRLEQGLY